MLLFRSAYTELTLITLLMLMKELGRKSADKHTHTLSHLCESMFSRLQQGESWKNARDFNKSVVRQCVICMHVSVIVQVARKEGGCRGPLWLPW